MANRSATRKAPRRAAKAAVDPRLCDFIKAMGKLVAAAVLRDLEKERVSGE